MHPLAAEVAAIEEELRQAMLASDVVVLDKLLDDALVFTLIDGQVIGKAADMHNHRSGAVDFHTLDPSEQVIQYHGDAAVVSVRMDATGLMGSDAFDSTLRFTRFWSHKPGGWRVVGGHVSVLT